MGISFQPMADNANRSDPISGRYFGSIEHADSLSTGLFSFMALFSILMLLVNKNLHPWWHDMLEYFFVLLVIFLFLAGLATRLYLTPRAEEKRRQDFFSNACNVSLIHERTVGYYNNNLAEPIERIAAQLLENSLFSKNISLKMAQFERKRLGLYFVCYLLAVFNRETDLELIAVVSQVIFSEQILSRYIRLEWLRMKSEKTFNEVYRMFQSKLAKEHFQVQTLDFLVDYERTKATAGITLSSRLFEQMNPALSREWECIKKKLTI